MWVGASLLATLTSVLNGSFRNGELIWQLSREAYHEMGPAALWTNSPIIAQSYKPDFFLNDNMADIGV